MHINIQPEVILKISVCILIGFVVFLVFSVAQFFSYRKAYAIITDIHTNSYESIAAESNSVKNYSIEYEYNIDGITYKCTCTTFRIPHKQVGEFATIRYNPQNPQILFSGNKTIIAIFAVIFLLLLILAIRKGRSR